MGDPLGAKYAAGLGHLDVDDVGALALTNRMAS
jgi:hypothetical protein